jgi:hypothetical protein
MLHSFLFDYRKKSFYFFLNRYYSLIIHNLLIFKNFFIKNKTFEKLFIYFNNLLSLSILSNNNQSLLFDSYGLWIKFYISRY